MQLTMRILQPFTYMAQRQYEIFGENYSVWLWLLLAAEAGELEQLQ